MKQFCFVLTLLVCAFGALPLGAGEIQDAAAAGDLDKVRSLLKAKPELANARELGTTPLHEAASHGHLPVVKLLVDGGAEINTLNSSRLTPLKLTIGYSHKDVADFLRQHGGLEFVTPPAVPPPAAPATNLAVPPPRAAPSAVPESRRPDALVTPRPAPATNPTSDLRPALTPVTLPIHDSADLGDAEAVTASLRAWPELLEAANEKGLTPLHVAAAGAKTNVAEVLLARRANVEARTKYGWTPLHFAATKGSAPMIELLLAHGAQVNVKTRTDDTPFLMAARGGHTNAVQLLLSHKADPNVRDRASSSSPLHFAAVARNLPLVALLLAAGADVNAVDSQGDTPLTCALAAGHDGIIDLLRQSGAKEPPPKLLSPLEQSLVDHYRALDQTFRTGSTADKRKALLGLVPTKAEVQKIFPKHAAEAWKVAQQLDREIRTALDKGALKDPAGEGLIWKIQPVPAGPTVQRYQAQGWLASEVPIFTLVVKKKGAKSAANEYCQVNNRWVPLPPLDRIFPE